VGLLDTLEDLGVTGLVPGLDGGLPFRKEGSAMNSCSLARIRPMPRKACHWMIMMMARI